MRAMTAMLFGLALLAGAPAMAAVAEQAPCEKPTAPQLRPVMATHTIPPYPADAKANKEEGTTLVQVVIGRDGIVTDAAVVKSSGSKSLDDAAAAHVKTNWRWETQADRCAPPITTRVMITWKLDGHPLDAAAIARVVALVQVDLKEYPPAALAARQGGAAVVAVVLDENGEPTVFGLVPTGFAELDAKSLELAKARYRIAPARMDGKPIGGLFMVAFLWVPPGAPAPDLTKLRAAIDFFATHHFLNGAPGGSVPPAP